MSEANAPKVTLDQLIAMNEEIAALVRAGVPLEMGLRTLGSDLPGRLGRIASHLADRTSQGVSLEAALDENSNELPPVYRAVVRAGMKSGSLTEALESLSRAARRIADIRHTLLVAMLYPLFVLVLAWIGFAAYVIFIMPIMLDYGFDRLDVPGVALYRQVAALADSAHIWGPGLPALVIVVAGGWLFFTRKATVAEPRVAQLLLGWVPWMRRILRWSRTVTFAELLAALLKNGMPLHEALVLAGEASGDGKILAGASQLAEALRRGDTVTAGKVRFGRSRDATQLPPLLVWLMAAGQRKDALVPALEHAADTYHRRAQHQANVARRLLPVIMTFALGGGAVVAYALMLFVPYVSMLHALGE